jgi:hypothetical protein
MLYIFNPLTLLVLYILWAHSSGIFKTLLTCVGGLIDVVVNTTYGSVAFWEFPFRWKPSAPLKFYPEFTLTKRTERLKADAGWRGALAWKLCDLLNYISPNHCKG